MYEKEVGTLQEAARFADEYALTHKTKFVSSPRPYQSGNKSASFNNSPKPYSPQENKFSSDKGKNPTVSHDKGKQASGPAGITCHYCKKPGHVVSECFALKRKQEKEVMPNAFVKNLKNTSDDLCPPCPKGFIGESKTGVSDSLRAEFIPFVSEGGVSLGENATPVPIRILRDTGASQSLILNNVLPFSDESDTGENNLIMGVDNEKIISVPLHTIFLKSDLVTGLVTVGLRPELPVKGVTMLLGNDLAGGKIVPSVQMTDKPVTEDDTFDVKIFPSCAVTRAMAQKVKVTEAMNDISDLKEDISCSSNDSNRTGNSSSVDTDFSDVYLGSLFDSESDQVTKPTDSDVVLNLSLSRKQLMQEQKDDPEIAQLREEAWPEDEMLKVSVGYFVKDGVLMRKWRPPDIAASEDWAVIKQVVVPKSYRNEILSMAHSLPLGGHLGVNKTVKKILRYFFWPGLRTDVANFCRTCHTCQMVGKPSIHIPVAPLHPIPAFGEPFSKVIIDCVGPLPKTRRGSQYMLTIMCAATRFPEAIPLRNIKAETIATALIKFFTIFGLPKEIQSDQGSNFMSRVFQQLIYRIGAKQIISSAYHPESQGALERFHSTLKTMIRIFCVENEKDWDEGVHLLLFAARESVQESLGFSPFELVFGHNVRGPLSLLNEQWSYSDTQIGLLDYVLKFKERLRKACELAKQNLQSAQHKMKTWYDRKARSRSFGPGDKVLVLFPLQGNPLQAKCHGPYEISSKLSDLNYVVKTPDRRKSTQLCHINMLKPYHQKTVDVVAIVTSPDADECFDDPDPPFKLEIIPSKLSNSEVLQNLDGKLAHLDPLQQTQMKDLILQYPDIFPDVPRRTSVTMHDVDVGDSRPIKQHPYRMSPEKCRLAEKEIEYMLEHGFIQPSSSNWSSPCVLVPKPDGGIRFCTDYRKVNAISITDAFPIPRVDDYIDRSGKSKFLTKIDLLKGYWCVPLTERARTISAFATGSGLYEYNVLPFGMKNAPATFQRMMQNVIRDLPNTYAYIDDIVTGNDDWDEHLESVGKLFQKLSEATLNVNLAKSEFACGTITYLGYVVGQGKVAPVEAKIQAINSFPVPTGKKAVRRLLGMAGYYRKFCKNFAAITLPLTNLLHKEQKFTWTDSCQKSFEQLKSVLCCHPILKSPDFSKPFSIAVDASDSAAGAVLQQKNDHSDIEHPVAYFSKKFNKHQQNYSTIEKELLALILALQHFEVYVDSSLKPLIAYSDHNPLVFLSNMKNKNRRLLNWSLILQEHDLKIVHVKGKDNVIADCLSRC